MEFRTRETTSQSKRRPIRRSAIVYTHTMDDTTGVNIPIASAIDTNTAPAKSKWNKDGSGLPARLRRRVAATEIRSSNKPIPGPPRENIENNRCTSR